MSLEIKKTRTDSEGGDSMWGFPLYALITINK